MYSKHRLKYKEYRQRQAGKVYENYVAQLLRQEGWVVDESGRNGFKDHGIDLNASKDGVRRYIQCKGWKREWFIHDDVVSQLYGSVAAIEGTENLKGVECYIYSPAQLDSYASAEAKRLNIQFGRLDYPKWYHRPRYYRLPRKHGGHSVGDRSFPV